MNWASESDGDSGFGHLCSSIRRLFDDKPRVRIIPKGIRSSSRLQPVAAQWSRRLHQSLSRRRGVELASEVSWRGRSEADRTATYVLLSTMGYMSGDLVMHVQLVDARSYQVIKEVTGRTREEEAQSTDLPEQILAGLLGEPTRVAFAA